MKNDHQQSELFGIYDLLKQKPVELLTPEEWSDAVKQDIRCIGLIPEWMTVKDIPALSKQEIEDIRLVSDDDVFEGLKYPGLPPERRTEAVSQAAFNAEYRNLHHAPGQILTDEIILSVLRQDGIMLHAIDKDRLSEKMYMTALENHGMALMFFPKEMITPDVAMKAVKENEMAIGHVPDDIKTPEICRAALNPEKVPSGKDYDVIVHVPFPDVCLEYLKKMEHENEDLFLVFGNIKPEIITPEMAQLAVKIDPSCLQFVPDRMKTSEMCAVAVEKDWMNMRFLPERMKTKGISEIAMNQSIHAQQLVPRRNLSPEMYMYPMKVNGMDLEYVPEKFRTPEVCLQAVMSNRHAKDFVPEWTNKEYNIYDFYQKFKNEHLIAEYLSFEQIQKVFQGETVHINGLRFAPNVTFKDLIIDYDRNTHRLNVKAIEGTGKFENPEQKLFEKLVENPEKKQKIEDKPAKRKGIKM